MRAACFSLAVLVAVAPAAALAQAPAYEPASPRWAAPLAPVPVLFTSDVAATRFSLVRVADRRFIGRGTMPCVVPLYRGRYVMKLESSDDVASGTRTVDIEQRAQVSVSPDPPWQRPAGLTLGILGIPAMLAGMALVLAATTCGEQDGHCAPRSREQAVGGVVLAGGFGITVGGWVLFGTSLKPGVETRAW